MEKDSAIVIPRAGKNTLQWSPNRGFAVEVNGTAAMNFQAPPTEERKVSTELLMALNAINTFASYAEKMPEVQPDKDYCLQEIEKCKLRLFADVKRTQSNLIGATTQTRYLESLKEANEIGAKYVYEALAAFEHFGAKVQQTAEVIRLIMAMKQEAEAWKAKALSANPVESYPDRDEYTPKFFADRTGIDPATVRYHLKQLQERHGRKKHSKDEGRWRIFDKEQAQKFEAYLLENGRKKPVQGRSKALK